MLQNIRVVRGGSGLLNRGGVIYGAVTRGAITRGVSTRGAVTRGASTRRGYDTSQPRVISLSELTELVENL